MSARAEDAARALSREQPTTADAAVPAPANNGSADAEGVEIPAPEPSGNKNLLAASAYTMDAPASTRAATVENTGQQPHRHHMALRSQVSAAGDAPPTTTRTPTRPTPPRSPGRAARRATPLRLQRKVPHLRPPRLRLQMRRAMLSLPRSTQAMSHLAHSRTKLRPGQASNF